MPSREFLLPYAARWPTGYAASEIDVLDDFEFDGSGYAHHALTHDAAGNLTGDGAFLYTYDPWNHLTQVHRAYHDGSGVDGDGDGSTADPERGSLVASFTYDGLGRRVSKAVTNMADLDATYYYYYDGDRCVEVRNGSHEPIKNYVWAPMSSPDAGAGTSVGGPGYVDELVQIIHHVEIGAGVVQTYHWALQDVNHNVLGLVQAQGDLMERYEYAPYSRREVYIQSGVNDGRVQSRTEMSRRMPDGVTMLDEPYGMCAIGHQGLMHDEELGLIHNRARTLHPRLRRFMQRDPAGYVDGMGLYEYVGSMPVSFVDFSGEYAKAIGCTASERDDLRWFDSWSQAWISEWLRVLRDDFAPGSATYSRFGIDTSALRRQYGRWHATLGKVLWQTHQRYLSQNYKVKCHKGCLPAECNTDTNAFVRWPFSVLNFCPQFWVMGNFYVKSGIYFHEMTHMAAGTGDDQLGQSPFGGASWHPFANDAYWLDDVFQPTFLHSGGQSAFTKRFIDAAVGDFKKHHP